MKTWVEAATKKTSSEILQSSGECHEPNGWAGFMDTSTNFGRSVWVASVKDSFQTFSAKQFLHLANSKSWGPILWIPDILCVLFFALDWCWLILYLKWTPALSLPPVGSWIGPRFTRLWGASISEPMLATPGAPKLSPIQALYWPKVELHFLNRNRYIKNGMAAG